MASESTFDQSALRAMLKEMRTLDVKLQKKVFTQATNATARKVILPAVKAKINARSTDVFFLPYTKRGLMTPELSHTSPPGTLKRQMKVRALKRTRTAVGRLIATPPRAVLGITDKSPSYYPAFLEYGSSKFGRTPKPYLRGTLEANQKKIESFFTKEARNRMKQHFPGGRI